MGFEIHGHGEISPAVVTVIEYGYFAPAGVFASDLDSVFNRFGTGIKQRGALFKLARGSAI
jgi:hypothetical protein